MDIITTKLLTEFQQEWELGDLPKDKALESFTAFGALSEFYEDEFAPDEFRLGGPGDCGFDAFGVLINGKLFREAVDVRKLLANERQLDVRFVIVQAKSSESFDSSVILNLLDKLSEIMVHEKLPFGASQEVRNILDCARAVYSDIRKLSDKYPELHVYYAATGDRVAPEILNRARAAQQRLADSNRFSNVEFKCWDRNHLRQAYRRASSAVSASFRLPRSYPLDPMPDVEQAYQGVIKAADLVRQLLTDATGNIRKALFYENLRYFQGDSSVNEAIRATLRSPVQRRRFTVLNQGVTIVTRKMTAIGDRFNLGDFQIVDGCQTCHVLFQEADHLTDDVRVKIQIVHSKDENVISDIIAATNRHNAIDEADLVVSRDFHNRLQEFFSAQSKPRHLYYEWRSNEYLGTGVEKTRVVSMPQLRRAYVAMFLDDPVSVGRTADMQRQHKGRLFQNGDLLEAYFLAAAAHYRLEWLIRNGRVPKEYKNAKYHLLAAVKMDFLRNRALPRSPKDARKKCAEMLALVWHESDWENYVISLLPVLQRAIDLELSSGASAAGEMFRTKRFATRMRELIIPGR